MRSWSSAEVALALQSQRAELLRAVRTRADARGVSENVVEELVNEAICIVVMMRRPELARERRLRVVDDEVAPLLVRVLPTNVALAAEGLPRPPRPGARPTCPSGFEAACGACARLRRIGPNGARRGRVDARPYAPGGVRCSLRSVGRRRRRRRHVALSPSALTSAFLPLSSEGICPLA
jgi:hypothetical protein